MTFEEMFQQAKSALTKASAAKVTEHIAVQFNVTGEGEGIFYAEINNGLLAVEPYDYRDNDAILTADSAALLAALKNADTAKLNLEGNGEKIDAFRSVLATLPAPKKAEAKPVAKAAAPKKTEAKAAAPKAAAVKPAAAVTSAPKAEAKPAVKAAEAPKAVTGKTTATGKTTTTGKKNCGRKK
ncbi:MAG: hypothetical protein ACI4XB_03345 [Ruminococcus sp.]